MRNITRDTITDAVTRSFEGVEDERTKLLISRLIAHLHAYAREVALTPEEWKTAIDFLHHAGRISNDGRNEFILASDVLGLSSLIDMLESGAGATERSALGPFHAGGSPALEPGGDLKRGNSGEKMLVRGRVVDTSGKPLPGATLDFWQAATNGLYWQQDPAQDRNNLRCTMSADAEGRYAFTTVRPAPYTVPDDGPVGDLLRAGKRRAWRPAHFHFIVSAAGHRQLTTELFLAGDPYLDDDAVFGVREALVLRTSKVGDEAVAEFDFRLEPA